MRGRNRKGPNPLSRSFESNGPDVKIRGTAAHIAEKYVTLARDAASSGDRVAEQNYLQHAEHYFRIVAAAQAQMPQAQQQQNNPRFDSDDDDELGEQMNGVAESRPQIGLADPQPYINGDAGEPNGHGRGEMAQSEMADSQGNNGGNGGGRSRNRRPPRERAPQPEAVGADEDPAASTTED